MAPTVAVKPAVLDGLLCRVVEEDDSDFDVVEVWDGTNWSRLPEEKSPTVRDVMVAMPASPETLAAFGNPPA